MILEAYSDTGSVQRYWKRTAILEAYSDTGSVQRYWKRTVILEARCSQTVPADQSRFVSSKGYEYDDYQDKL